MHKVKQHAAAITISVAALLCWVGLIIVLRHALEVLLLAVA
ncbi:MAG: hypothetical protein ACU85U_02385 [Gammaproteobacteria bacterium]